MRPESGWQGKLTAWIGWMLGAALVTGLAVLTLVLSLDGARLRRLAGMTSAGERDNAVAYVPGFEVERKEPAGSVARPRQGGTAAVAAADPGPVIGRVAGGDSTGWLVAGTTGASEGIDVFLDGKWKGVTPLIVPGVAPGPHDLSFAVGNRCWSERVTVALGDTAVAACAAPEGSGSGRLVVVLPERPEEIFGSVDSVLVDGRLLGGELSAGVNSGYHSVSFIRESGARSDVVLLVPEGSIQYVSPPEPAAPFSIEGRSPSAEGGKVRFEARLRGSVLTPPKLSLQVLDEGGSSFKSAAMPWDPSGSAYAGAVATRQLPRAGELRYFFRAFLDSGEEIDSPIFTYASPNR